MATITHNTFHPDYTVADAYLAFQSQDYYASIMYTHNDRGWGRMAGNVKFVIAPFIVKSDAPK